VTIPNECGFGLSKSQSSVANHVRGMLPCVSRAKLCPWRRPCSISGPKAGAPDCLPRPEGIDQPRR